MKSLSKNFVHIVGFLLVLGILLLGREYLGDFTSILRADYTGIPIAGETQIEENLETTDLVNPDQADSNDQGIKILSGLLYYLIDILKAMLYAIALIYIIIAGFRIITAQGNEETIKSNYMTIVFSIFGFIIILLADVAVRYVFYGGEGSSAGDIGPGECLMNPDECATKGSEELLGLVYWGKSLLAVVAFLEIVVSGIRMIMAMGNEETTEKEKKVFMWVGIGLLLLAIDEVVINKVLYIVDEDGTIKSNGRLKISTNLQQGINEFVGVIQFVLQFVAFIAVLALIYGGFLMVMNFGDDDKVTTAKTIIKDAIIGLIVAFSAYTLVATVILR